MKTLFCLIFCGMLLCCGTDSVAEGVGELTTRLDRVELGLKRVQKNLAAVKKNAGGSGSDAAFMQVQELEQSVRTLTGDVETLRFKHDKLEERLNKINTDNDLRFKSLEDKISKLQGRLDKMSEAERKAAKEKEREKAKEAATVKAGQQKMSKIKAEYGSLKADELYKQAMAALKKNDYKNAEARFEAVTVLYPKHKLAGNAQYWMGESFYARGNYEQAAVAFADGFKLYRDSQKAPDNLLKLGLTMSRLNKKKEACIAFKTFGREYPKVSDAMKKRLESETKKAGCR